MRLSFGGGRVESHRPSTLAPNNRLAVSWFQKERYGSRPDLWLRFAEGPQRMRRQAKPFPRLIGGPTGASPGSRFFFKVAGIGFGRFNGLPLGG